MKTYDYEAVTFQGDVYCTGCLPAGASLKSNEVTPIFADSEWDDYPACGVCGQVHDYVNLTGES